MRAPLSLLPFVCLLTAACGASESNPPSTGDPANDAVEDDAAPIDAGPWAPPAAAVCNPTSAWDGSAPLFRDATSDWGLDAIGAEGVRIAVADVDGDGWPDLLIRRGGTRPEPLSGDGARSTWLLRNEGGQRFRDITADSGILAIRGSDGSVGQPIDVVAFADVDNDGDLDLYNGIQTVDPGQAAGATSELLRNSGAGEFTFTRDTNAVRAAGRIDSPAGASFVDVDLDGNIDLWVTQNGATTPSGFAFAQDHLFLGDGTGLFRDATDELGLTTEDWIDVDAIDAARAHSRAWSSAACDLDNDGLPELLAASYGRAPNHLWHAVAEADGSIRYENVSVASGYAYDDNQTWDDNEFARCFCQQNPTEDGCAGVAAPRVQCSPNWSHATDRRPFRLGGNSGTTVCADLNNDGSLDLITTEIRHWWAGEGSDATGLLYNLGESPPRFRRPDRAETGLEVPIVTSGGWDEGHMTATALDVDNDGRLDLYIGASDYPGNRGLLYLQGEDGRFTLAPTSAGIDHNRSHGVAVADLDGDGDLDLIVGHSRARCDARAPNDCYPTAQVRIFENVRGDTGNWVQLRLEGAPGTNRSAIGARVTLTTPDGLLQTRAVGGGHGHYGIQDDLTVHFGLGAHCEAEVTIHWPNRARTTQTFAVTSGHAFHVREGDDPAPIERAR